MRLNWSIQKIELPLKFDWKISRGTSAVKSNWIVSVEDSREKGMGEVAFNVRYGESLDSIERGWQAFLRESQNVDSLATLNELLCKVSIDNSLRFGIESAWIDFESKKLGQTVWQFLEVEEPSPVRTSFSLPILDVEEIPSFISSHGLQRFSFLKVKVDRFAVDSVRAVARCFAGPLRIDANEAWRTAQEVLKFAEEVKDIDIEFIEQPLPASAEEELRILKKNCQIPLIGDESLTDEGVSEYHAERFHGVNVKLMKAGGLLPALEQLRRARELGLKTMLGCMVETSLGISSALQISAGVDFVDLDGFLLLKEDPYGAVLEKDGRLFLN